ncbi:MAG: hypothetical protein WCG82_02840 [Bacteroidota bacterium]
MSRIINKEELRAKAHFLWTFNNPGLKPGVIDNETFVDFSPKSVFLVKILKRLNNYW